MKAAPVTRAIESCTSCPFADDGEAFDGEWTCHAEYDDNGWPLHLGGTKPPSRPPKWCALRSAPVLVQLAPRKRQARAAGAKWGN